MAEPWWRTGLQDLHRLEDRITSLYAERCHIDRDDNAIVLINKARTVHVPAAWLAVLLIGSGSRITHPAITLLADSGTAVCWVGEQGVRLYATGTSTASPVDAHRGLRRRHRHQLRQGRRLHSASGDYRLVSESLIPHTAPTYRLGALDVWPCFQVSFRCARPPDDEPARSVSSETGSTT
jgi:hypothetical protein